MTSSALSTSANSTGVGEDQVHRRSRGCSLSLSESLSTTTVDQGMPLSSTQVQHSQQDRPTRVSQTSEVPVEHTVLPPDNGSSHGGSTRLHPSQLNPGRTNPEQHQANLLQGGQTLRDVTNNGGRSEPVSPPPTTHHWLSLPSATPSQHSPHNSRQRDVSLQKKENSTESCREIGTQTLYVESIATQTDDGDEDKRLDPTTKGSMDVPSSSLTATEQSVDSVAMSVGDLRAPSAMTLGSLDKPHSRDLFEVALNQCHSTELDNAYDGHSGPDCGRSSEDEILLEELFTADLLNTQGTLNGGLQLSSSSRPSADLSTTSKREELLTFEEVGQDGDQRSALLKCSCAKAITVVLSIHTDLYHLLSSLPH